MSAARGRSCPPEIVDMIIDLLHDEQQALIACSLVHPQWLPRSRKYLFRELTIRPIRRGRIWSLFFTPEKIRQELSGGLLNLVERLVISRPHEGAGEKSVTADATLIRDLLSLMPNVNSLALRAMRLRGRKSKGEFTLNPENRRVLDVLELRGVDCYGQESQLYDILSLFPEITTLYLNQLGEGEQGLERIDVPRFPLIRTLVCEDGVTDPFVDGLLCGYLPDRLSSLESLSICLCEEDHMLDLSTILNDGGHPLLQLTLSIYNPISGYLYTLVGWLTDIDDLMENIPETFWHIMAVVDWNACLSLEHLTISCDICAMAEIEEMMSHAVMPLITFMLKDLARSEAACIKSAAPLELVLELAAFDARPILIEFCRNTPWDELKNVFCDLYNHPNIKLRHATIKLTGNFEEAEKPTLQMATTILRDGIRNLGLDFVHGPDVGPPQFRDPILPKSYWD